MSGLVSQEEVEQMNENLRGKEEEIRQWLTRALYAAFAEARRGKLNTVNEQRFEECRDVNLTRLVEKILRREYEPLRGVAFIITEPTPREIFAASFGDRTVHHFLVQQCGDYWNRRLLPRSFSCREGKGTLYGIRTLTRDIRQVSRDWTREAWVMKIDLLGYFMSLSREYLYSRVCWALDRQFAKGGPIYDICKYLWGQIIFDDPTDAVKIKGKASDWEILPRSKSLFYAKEGYGIVIGNLTSQWMSNLALDPLDRYVWYDLKCRHYGRYVDDAYFVAETKEELLEIRDKVAVKASEMGLVVHPDKFYLQKVSRGVGFLGAVVYPGRTVVSRRFKRNMGRLNQKIWREGLTQENLTSLTAYWGLAKYCNHKKTFDGVFGGKMMRELKKWQVLS